VRDRIAPGLPLAILSNSTTAGWPEVHRALAHVDERYMKLDAGDPITYARINGPGPSVASIVDSLRTLPPVVIQSMFVTDEQREIDNSTEGAIAEWLMALEAVNAMRVHVYTLDRPPALESLRAVPARRLREIAEHVRAAGIAADVFIPRASGGRSGQVA
jgi:wyosine [tRNA(Phe)-imidazoG37] synthetase (radical SAM superfamily)